MIKQKEVQRREAERFYKCTLSPGGVAIDGGAHVGSWSVNMAPHFDQVLAFEPCLESFNYLVENTWGAENIKTYNKALLDKPGFVDVVAPSGRTTLTARQVAPGSMVRATTIDSLNLTSCEFIKLDLEGCELPALRGAVEVIRQFKPYLVVEMNDEAGILKFLKQFNYKEQWRDGVDRGFAI